MSSIELQSAIESFAAPLGYLAAASIGIPPRQAVDALAADLALWSRGARDPQDYDAVIGRTRESYAAIVGVDVHRVAIGSQTSVIASLIAAAVPDGAEVLCIDGDFSSMMFPFLQRIGIRVRVVPGEALADSITDDTWLVAFSLVQSATGVVADAAAIVEAARRHGAHTFCDVTQAAGVLPVDAGMFDATVCNTYKWLCAPRGVAFLTVTEAFAAELTPLQAGWYAGEQVWTSTYGPAMTLASDARRFDVSPVWPAWIGAEQSIALFASLDIGEVWELTSGLGDELCERLGIAPQHQAIVTWPDSSGSDLARLKAAGIRAAGRAGRLRASFHLWNTSADVDAVVAAIRS
jgi:selenocysteine lyase/cysteine desulfurase